MHLKIIWLVTLTFYHNGHSNTLISYGHPRQLLAPQTIYRSSLERQTIQTNNLPPPSSPQQQQPQTQPVQQAPPYLPPAPIAKPVQSHPQYQTQTQPQSQQYQPLPPPQLHQPQPQQVQYQSQQTAPLQQHQYQPQLSQSPIIRSKKTYGVVQTRTEHQQLQYRPQSVSTPSPPPPPPVVNAYEPHISATEQNSQQQQRPVQTQSQSKPAPPKLISSYGPAASGTDPIHIGPPSAMPLPPLLAGSVDQQLMRTFDQQHQHNQHNQHNQYFNPPQYPTTLSPSSTSSSLPAAPISSSVISTPNIINPLLSVTGQPTISIPANNLTLYAANLLATALLNEPNPNLATSSSTTSSGNSMQQIMPPAFIQIGPNTFQQNQQSSSDNKTDLVIIKTQKTSYIISMTVSITTGGGPQIDKNKIHELYNQRDKLPIAYTVNQFLFFIKPENVNFLNKL